jgi:hypothetical protein
LLALAAERGVAVDQARDHFDITGGPKDLLVLRTTSTWDGGEKQRGKVLTFTNTGETEKLEGEVRELNEFIEQFEVGGGRHRGYFRVFNCGDDPDFAWNMGGRLYSYSNNDDSYQQLKKQQRLRMTINGEAVAEIDIKASFLTIYLWWFGQEPPGDPYQLPGLPDGARDIVKRVVVRFWGSDGKPLTRWPKKMVSDYRKETGRSLGRDYQAKVIQAKLLAAYPVLKEIAQHTWAKLMFLESEAVVSTMLRLKREHGVPSLSVHDSLIVPLSKQDLAAELLLEQYVKVVGVQPKLEIEHSPTTIIEQSLAYNR